MAAEPYTIEFQASPSDHVLATAARVEWDEVERVHRTNVSPQTLAMFSVELRLTDVQIEGATPGAVVTALSTFLTDTAHSRVLPTYVRIKDGGGVVVPEVGEIDTSTGWEDIQIQAFRLPAVDDPPQLQALARLDLVIRATRVFEDADNIVFLEQEFFEGNGPDGRTTRRLTSSVRMKSGTNLSTIASQLRLARPTGWARTVGNNSLGYDVTHDRYPLTHIGVTVSEVVRLGGAITATTNEGSATEVTEEQEDPVLGLLRTRTTAESTGGSDPRAEVESRKPAGGVGIITWDEGRATARGTWEVLGSLNPGLGGKDPKVTKIRRRFTLTGGKPEISITLMTGGAPAQVHKGPVLPYRLREEVTVLALGVEALEEIPLPPALGGFWVEDGGPFLEGLPRLLEPKTTRAQHLWEHPLTREYVWAGEGDPREDAALKAAVLAGETI